MARHEEVSVAMLETALSANSQSFVFSRLADSYRKQGAIPQAIGICMEGLKQHPDYVTGRVILGRCYLEQEKLREAVAEFVHVIEQDRRNQVALKMIADIYSRQGMKEKAGDLYAYLLRMDPENPSLARLASTHRGTDEINVYRILGIAPSKTAPVSQPSDMIADMDRTIQMDTMPQNKDPFTATTADDDIFLRTQKFDVSELSTPMEDNTLEEVVADSRSTGENTTVTGDDISSRMAMIFDEQGQDASPMAVEAKEESWPETTPQNIDEGDSDKRVRGDTVAAKLVDGKEPAASPVVSGSDITSRIEQLFGDPDEVVTDDKGVASDFTQVYEPYKMDSEDVGPQDISVATTQQYNLDDLKVNDSGSVSGEDVTDRINEMFADQSTIEGSLADIGNMLDSQQDSGVTQSVTEAMAPVQPFADLPVDPGPDTSIAGPADVDPSEYTMIDSVERTDPSTVSGDDIALRLESIFDDDSDKIAATSSDTNIFKNIGNDYSVYNEVPESPAEETRAPVEVNDGQELIPSDKVTDETNGAEATLFGLESVPVVEDDVENVDVEQKGSIFPAIDDTVVPDEQPSLSGDDVAIRLEELFAEDQNSQGALDTIPEGDKEQEDLNQGFYTMSGENAEDAKQNDEMLEQLDTVEAEDAVQSPDGEEPVIEGKTIFEDLEDVGSVFPKEESLDDKQLDALPGQPVFDLRGEATALSAEPEMPVPSITDIDDTLDVSSESEIDKTEYSIPDHVLTPTLADIYYQQGQPGVALSMYQRLLEKDPDNEKLSRRILEIEQLIAEQGENSADVLDVLPVKKDVVAKRPLPSQVEPPAQESTQPRPLSGVRIKKKFKKRITSTIRRKRKS